MTAVAVCAAAAVAGCQSTPVLENEPTNGPLGVRAADQYRYRSLAPYTDPAVNSEKLLVILSFSGGGTRAAALAYGVLERLRATTVRLSGERRRRSLLGEVDVISATSGGSFTAAFYGLFRERMFARLDNGRTLFEERMLKRRLQRRLTGVVLGNLFRVFKTDTNRSDIAAELYGNTIFENKTFADLVRRGRPYIIINAHDTTKGRRFEFTQDQFDLICSDLSTFSVARAVTASSAFHGFFAPIKLRNHDLVHCPHEPAWVRDALNGDSRAVTPADNPRDRLIRARLARWYRNKMPDGLAADPHAKYYVHLGDGGATDNLGLQAPLLGLTSIDSNWGLREKLESGEIRKVLLIVVSAATVSDPNRDRTFRGPTITQMIAEGTNGAINTVSDNTLRWAQWVLRDLRTRVRRRGRRAPQVYGPVIVEFENIRDGRERACFKRIITSLSLPAPQVDALRRVSWSLLAGHGEFRRFLRDADGRLAPMPAPPGAAACPPEG